MVQLILKVSSRCNLNCTYCYVYNKADTSWKRRPALMSEEVFHAAIHRTLEYCSTVGEDHISISFHGGEPCLIGSRRFRDWCSKAREWLSALNVHFSIQTNGTLIDSAWIGAFHDHEVGVGVSIDGPAEVHDRYRVDHRGRGSHAKVARALQRLRKSGVRHGLLCVIPLGCDPVAVHTHFMELGTPMITYLLPDYTHDNIKPVRESFGDTPCADFLISVFDIWCSDTEFEVRVQDLWNVCRVIMGGRSALETIGNPAPQYFFVETDGSIEGLDALKVCEDGISDTHLNVLTSNFSSVRKAVGVHALSIFQGMPLPDSCHGCEEATTCAGGHLPHRFSSKRGFNNESVWCDDLKKLFAHVRKQLGVTVTQTPEYRRRLEQIRQRSATAHKV